jgi:hypothetical protein
VKEAHWAKWSACGSVPVKGEWLESLLVHSKAFAREDEMVMLHLGSLSTTLLLG